MGHIIWSNYPELAKFGVLAGDGKTYSTQGSNITGKVGDGAGTTAHADLQQLSDDIFAVQSVSIPIINGELGTTGVKLTISTPGIYRAPQELNVYGDITLEGGPDDQYFFIGGPSTPLRFWGGSSITLTGGLKPYNVFWLSTGEARILTNKTINGTIIANNDILSTMSGTINGGVYSLRGNISINGGNISPSFPGPIVCYAAGTKILTKAGYVAIEELNTGDEIVARGNIRHGRICSAKASLKPIVWIGSFEVNTASKNTMPICIKANAFGDMPTEDLYVSPNHKMILNNREISAKDLINGTTIVQEYGSDIVTYYHLELPNHSAIIANGVLAESYLDVKNRSVFQKSKASTKSYPKMRSLLIRR